MRLPRQGLEPQRVHLAFPSAQHVAGVLGDQHPGRRTDRAAGFEHAAQLRDVGLYRREGRRWRLVPPQQVDQPVHRDDMIGLHHQDRQQRALQPRAEINLPAAAVLPGKGPAP